MIRIIEMTCTKSRKINLGNYESTDIFTAVKAELTEGSVKEFEDGRRILSDLCDKDIQERYERIIQDSSGG